MATPAEYRDKDQEAVCVCHRLGGAHTAFRIPSLCPWESVFTAQDVNIADTLGRWHKAQMTRRAVTRFIDAITALEDLVWKPHSVTERLKLIDVVQEKLVSFTSSVVVQFLVDDGHDSDVRAQLSDNGLSGSDWKPHAESDDDSDSCCGKDLEAYKHALRVIGTARPFLYLTTDLAGEKLDEEVFDDLTASYDFGPECLTSALTGQTPLDFLHLTFNRHTKADAVCVARRVLCLCRWMLCQLDGDRPGVEGYLTSLGARLEKDLEARPVRRKVKKTIRSTP